MSEQQRTMQSNPELVVVGNNLDQLGSAEISAIRVDAAEIGVDLETGELLSRFAIYGIMASLGMTNAEIGQETKSNLAEATIKGYISDILDATEVTTRAGLARYFFEIGTYTNTFIAPPVSPIQKPAHRETLEGISYGKTAREIGKDLYIAQNTVKFRVRKMSQRSGWRGHEQLVLAAFAAGDFGCYALQSTATSKTTDRIK